MIGKDGDLFSRGVIDESACAYSEGSLAPSELRSVAGVSSLDGDSERIVTALRFPVRVFVFKMLFMSVAGFTNSGAVVDFVVGYTLSTTATVSSLASHMASKWCLFVMLSSNLSRKFHRLDLNK